MGLGKIGYNILRLISRDPKLGRYSDKSNLNIDENIDHSLIQLKTMFPGFLDQIRKKTIIDFGCGQGFQAFALAKSETRFVVGIDINEKHIRNAQIESNRLGLKNILFQDSIENLQNAKYDIIISHNSFEHFAEPEIVLQKFRLLISLGGKVYISFGPPWYSPYGAHTSMFCKFPWIHLIFQEKTVMQVRALFTSDGAFRYKDVRGGLNFMSLKKFEHLLIESNFKVEYKKYIYMLNMNIIRSIPIFREIFLYHINVILVPK